MWTRGKEEQKNQKNFLNRQGNNPRTLKRLGEGIQHLFVFGIR